MNPLPYNLDQWVNHLSKEELSIELKKRGLSTVGNVAGRRNRLIKNYDLPINPNYARNQVDDLIPNPTDDQNFENNINHGSNFDPINNENLNQTHETRDDDLITFDGNSSDISMHLNPNNFNDSFRSNQLMDNHNNDVLHQRNIRHQSFPRNNPENNPPVDNRYQEYSRNIYQNSNFSKYDTKDYARSSRNNAYSRNFTNNHETPFNYNEFNRDSSKNYDYSNPSQRNKDFEFEKHPFERNYPSQRNDFSDLHDKNNRPHYDRDYRYTNYDNPDRRQVHFENSYRPQDFKNSGASALETMRKWNLKFVGSKSEDPEAFLMKIREGHSIVPVSDETLLQVMPFFLSGIALNWFRGSRHLWKTFEDFCYSFRSRFVDPDFQF